MKLKERVVHVWSPEGILLGVIDPETGEFDNLNDVLGFKAIC